LVHVALNFWNLSDRYLLFPHLSFLLCRSSTNCTDSCHTVFVKLQIFFCCIWTHLLFYFMSLGFVLSQMWRTCT
jgi:hypothetical protein